MTSEQLQHARAERWRQTSNPLLTSEDAAAWLDSIGLCLYLPRHAHFRTPTPSFVEAVSGTPTETAARAAIEAAAALLHQLTAHSQAVPLNLFGEAGGGSSDQPDFLVTRANLPYVFSMVGGRNWKSGPGAKASPLMQEVWTLLDKDAPLTASEIQTALGRELTEAAVLRALVELWRGLRVIPIYDAGTTRWELTQARFAEEMTASQKIAQTTALSLLVALYLESTLAASTDDIETFLSPLAPRSRVREVVNGLQATRQIAIVSVGAQPLLHVPGSLPEFEEETPEPVQPRLSQQPHHFEPRRPESRPERGERKPYDRERKPFDRERKPYDRERKPFQRHFQKNDRFAKRGDEAGKPARESFRDNPWERRGPDRGQERPQFRARRSEEGSERGDRPFRDDKRGEKRFGGEKKFGEKRFSGPKKFGPKKFDSGRPFGGKKRFEDRGPSDRGQERGARGERPDRREDRGEKRPFFRDRGTKSQGERPRRFEGEKPRRFDDERPRFAKREGGWKRDSERGGESFRKGPKPGFPRRGKPDFAREDPQSENGKRRPFGNFSPKPGRKSTEKSGKRFDKSDKPYAKSGKPFGKSARPFGKTKSGKLGKPAFGARKPGGFKPPFRKRKPEGSGDAE